MKIALINNNKVRILYSIEKPPLFPFSVGLNSGGQFDNADDNNQTTISFDPDRNVLQSHLFSSEEHAAASSLTIDELKKTNSDNYSIQLNY